VKRGQIDARIVREAAEWLGTPFVWGQSVKAVGCDCKGLLAGVMRELGRAEADSLYANFASYRVDRPVPAPLLVEGFEQLFERSDEIAPGRLLLLNFAGRPGHMAIAVGEGRAIHAYPGRRSAVCERDLEVLLHRFPLHSAWRVPRVPKCR
jgi:cell wall-associated NlpC family hydrolase